MEEPAAYPPPCIQNMTGFFAAGSQLSVHTFRYWQCSEEGQKRWGVCTSPVGIGSFSTGHIMP